MRTAASPEAQQIYDERILAVLDEFWKIRDACIHTVRHWKASTEYHRTRDIIHVKEMLGHKAIQSTLIYTHLKTFKSDEYHSAAATDIEDARSRIEAGFEYVCTHQDTMVFRKRK